MGASFCRYPIQRLLVRTSNKAAMMHPSVVVVVRKPEDPPKIRRDTYRGRAHRGRKGLSRWEGDSQSEQEGESHGSSLLYLALRVFLRLQNGMDWASISTFSLSILAIKSQKATTETNVSESFTRTIFARRPCHAGPAFSIGTCRKWACFVHEMELARNGPASCRRNVLLRCFRCFHYDDWLNEKGIFFLFTSSSTDGFCRNGRSLRAGPAMPVPSIFGRTSSKRSEPSN